MSPYEPHFWGDVWYQVFPDEEDPGDIRCPNCDEWMSHLGGRVWRCRGCGYQEQR